MPRVLITGMSGVGKSTLLDGLAQRGHAVVDTDHEGWVLEDGRWDEPRMRQLLEHTPTVVVSGTVENQGDFYPLFDHVVLLSAPLQTLLERVTTRTTNPYGRRQQERDEIAGYLATVEPLLRRGATLELDGRDDPGSLVAAVEALLDDQPARTVPMLVISGAPGVGKTTVAWEVFSRCAARGGAPAMADLDLLGAAWPAPDDDPFQHRLKTRNLAAVWANFRAAGSRCLVVAAVIETRAELDLLNSAVGADALLCRLTASDATLAHRVQERGRESGDDLTTLVRRSAELSAQLAEHDLDTLVVDTEGRSVGDVTEDLLAAWLR